MKGLVFLLESSGSLPIDVLYIQGKRMATGGNSEHLKKYTWHDELIMCGKVHSIDVFKHKLFMQSQCWFCSLDLYFRLYKGL